MPKTSVCQSNSIFNHQLSARLQRSSTSCFCQSQLAHRPPGFVDHQGVCTNSSAHQATDWAQKLPFQQKSLVLGTIWLMGRSLMISNMLLLLGSPGASHGECSTGSEKASGVQPSNWNAHGRWCGDSWRAFARTAWPVTQPRCWSLENVLSILKGFEIDVLETRIGQCGPTLSILTIFLGVIFQVDLSIHSSLEAAAYCPWRWKPSSTGVATSAKPISWPAQPCRRWPHPGFPHTKWAHKTHNFKEFKKLRFKKCVSKVFTVMFKPKFFLIL